MHQLQLTDDNLKTYLAVVEDWIPEEASIAVALGEQYILYLTGTYQIDLQQGDPLFPEGIARAVIRTKQKVEKLIDSKSIRTPYYGIGYPIYVNGDVGALIILLPPRFAKEGVIQILTGKQQEDWFPISVSKITHIESFEKRTWFYTNEEQYQTNYTLKDLQLRLPVTFMRIHRSFIVNLNAIKRISKDFSSNYYIVLTNGSELPVSQKYMQEIKNVLHF